MRRLAAIMFTDIQGFTAKMQHDESKAVELLARHKGLFLDYTREFKGKVIKYMGDGTLTIFDSTVQAVRCAIALQQAFNKKPVIPVRIGIHIGEVIVDDQDIIGDAVNLSSRIQAAGIAGSVFISEKVKEEIYNHPDIVTLFLGPHNLKNIRNPVNLYAIVAEGLVVPESFKSSEMKKETKAKEYTGNPFLSRRFKLILAASISLLILVFVTVQVSSFVKSRNNTLLKSIAILPFKNNGSSEDNYIAEGVTEDMITFLTVIPNLTVKKIPIKGVSGHNMALVTSLLKDIEVEGVLEGSVKHTGDSLILFSQLKDAQSGKIIWEHTFYDKYDELAKVQQKVIVEIAEALHVKLNKDELKTFVRKRSSDPEAEDFYKRGRYAQVKRTKIFMDEAIFYFRKALSIDSSFALAYSGISDNYVLQVDNGILPYDSGINVAREAIELSFLLDSSLAEVRASKALFLITLEGKREEGINELKNSIEQRPKYPAAHQWYALELAANSKFNLALSEINYAKELEPFSERIWVNKCMILLYAGRYKDDIDLLDSLKYRFPNTNQYYKQKTECYYWLGKPDSMLVYARYLKDVFDYAFWNAVVHHDKSRLKENLREKLAIAAQQNTPLDNEQMATYYVFMGETGKAINYIEDAFNNKEFSWLKFLNVSPTWAPLRTETRFRNVLLKLGF